MFRTLLVANRGEVAVRVARAARELGIRTVGVHSEADRGLAWTKQLDELVCIGPGPSRDSYLRMERIVQAALQTGATAIHPGWGFLAENARFAALCEQHGITFVGPSPRSMEQMGLKTPAKRAMRAAGMPVIPGSDGPCAGVDDAVRAADAAGYPVILKADAGGGGRGMRQCADAAAVRAAFPQASSEAAGAFGNGAVYVEKYLTGGRHIEVQVLGDRYGDAVHLYERDCSVQRNHQKLVEECPSPALSPAEREALGARAAAACRAIGYRNAGTIELLRSASGELFFLEMNTRLQVEHPVTEMVTGVDIVKEQLAIAANRRLSFRQEDVVPRGHAIEVRVNAEDPSQGFRPSPGVLERFEIPTDRGPGRVRVETHVVAGDEIPPHYDSLIAKVIAHGDTRAAAIETLERTLAATRIEGVATTIPLHRAVLASPEFRSGEYDTRAIPGFRTQRDSTQVAGPDP